MNPLDAKAAVAITDWFAAHPNWDRLLPSESSAELALAVVHWHHNVEASKRSGEPGVEGNEYFLRQYVKQATIKWLKEAYDKLNRIAGWYERRDQAVLVYTLQRALDDFEVNDKAKVPVHP